MCATDLVTSDSGITYYSFGHATLGITTFADFQWTVHPNSQTNLTNLTIPVLGKTNLDFTAGGSTTCTAGTANAASCILDVQFKPAQPGLRRGSVILTYIDESVDPQVTRTLTLQVSAFVDSPVAAVAPGNLNLLSGGSASFQSPGQVAVDGSGNLYVANSTADNVVKINAGGTSSSIVNTGSTVLGTVGGVALDGSGNLYIADTTNSKIVKVSAAGVVEVDTITGPDIALNAPSALTMDAQANLYIADNGNARILELPFADIVAGNASPTATLVPTPGITFTPGSITGLAVDSTGILYVTDGTRVVTVTADRTSASSFSIPGFTVSNPAGIAVDGFDNLYIGDSGNSRILQVINPATSPVANALTYTFAGTPIGTSLNGLAVDPNGNVYLSDTANNRIFELTASTGKVSFPSTTPGDSSAPATVSITNIGNQSLAMTSESSGSANFSVAAVSPCVVQVSGSPSLSIATGNTCEYNVTFSPMSSGSLSTNLTFTDSNLNHSGSTQLVALSGVATLLPQSITFNALGNQSYGAAPFIVSATATSGLTVTFASLTPTVCAVSGATVTLLATGACTIQASQSGNSSYQAATPVSQSFTITQTGNTITFSALPSQVLGTAPFAISASASSGLAVTFASLTPAVCTVSGSTVTLLATGACTIQATQPGNTTFQAATPVSQSFTVSPSPVSSVTISSSPNPSMVNQTVTFTATVSSNVGSNPAGQIQFFDGATLLESSPVSGSSAVFSTSSLAIGLHTIVASYSGGAGGPASRASLLQIVNGSPVTMTLQVSPVTLVYGQPFSLSASVAAQSGTGTPTGQVSFYRVPNLFSQVQLSTAPLAVGAASINVSTPVPAGITYFQAQYSGDNNFAGGFSQAQVTIQPASTNSSLSLSADGSQLQVTVTPVAPGAGTPTGTVQFIDFSTNSTITTATLSSGSASVPATTSLLTGSVYIVYSGDPNFQASSSPVFSNGATGTLSSTVAPDEIVRLNNLFGLGSNVSATALPLTNSLGGVTVSITDSAGNTYPTLLYGIFGSTDQISLVIPSQTATGPATVTIQLPNGGTLITAVQVAGSSPGFFPTTQTVTDPSSGITYLSIYGTGFRHATTVTATINGTPATVSYFGPQQVSPGLDQLNLELPPGTAAPFAVTITVDGAANTLTIPQ